MCIVQCTMIILKVLMIRLFLFFFFFINFPLTSCFFQQTVCGCDLLRTHGKSYVCDVNGFSFVKTSKKYYDDAAQVLIGLIVQELAPQLYRPYHLDVPEEIPAVEALNGTMLELRCVVGIIRHGDRTPKQKMKMEVRHPR